MPVEILMPELGESVHEGTVSRWLKKEGEAVKEDEPVVEIMTDKVNTELPAPASGVLSKILIQEGELVKVFAAMGIIDETGSAAKTAPAKETAGKTKEKPAEAPKAEPRAEPAAAESERTWFTPVVRSIAKEHGLDDATLSTISGSGAGGRVTRRDVEAYLESREGAPAPAGPQPAAVGPDQEVVKLAGMRKMIADALTRSSQVPTVSTTIDVDVSRMVEFRAHNKESFLNQYGLKLTYTPFFIKAVTEALQEFPLVNASLQEDDKIVMHRGVTMGVAVSLGQKGDQGLIVPVLRDTHKKSLVEIAKELDSIADKARNNGLKPDDVQGGTFTLTNPGSYGALFGTPMINAPQAGILGTYAIRQEVVVRDGMIGIRPMMYLVLTYDHRIVDGLLAGRFLQSVRDKLQSFDFFK
ncbi:MAG: 2-oxo acid dehydrogenase subunit E2 [Fimbriimonadaceae bacterium]|nr:2-oxo acid dehydrogenase subunit E2 [Fimbriimonadaceae bacterium]